MLFKGCVKFREDSGGSDKVRTTEAHSSVECCANSPPVTLTAGTLCVKPGEACCNLSLAHALGGE